MNPIADDLRDLLLELHAAQAEFLIVGGYAVSHYGYSRATKDIDIFVRPSEANGARVMLALEAFGAPVSQLQITRDDFAHPGKVVQLGVAPVRADLITSIDGVSFDEAARESETLSLAGCELRVIGFDALIANKRASARDQDLLDIKNLERIRRATEPR